MNVDTWMRAKRYLARSLSETPIRACKRFFVSENFSPFREVRLTQRKISKPLTRFTTNLKGTPWVRDNSFEKWKTPMTLSESSASSSSRGISYRELSRSTSSSKMTTDLGIEIYWFRDIPYHFRTCELFLSLPIFRDLENANFACSGRR